MGGLPDVGEVGGHHAGLGLADGCVKAFCFAVALCERRRRADGAVGVHGFGLFSFSVRVSVSAVEGQWKWLLERLGGDVSEWEL